MHNPHKPKRKEQKKTIQPSSRGLSPNPRSNAQQKASSGNPADNKPDMDARRSGTPDAQLEGQSQASGTRDPKITTRSYDISGPPHGSQGTAQDPSFGKPKRSGTHPNLTHHMVTEENDLLKRSNADIQRHIDSLQQGTLNQHERILQAENQLQGANKQLRESQERARMLEIECDNLRAENDRQRFEANSTIQSIEREHLRNKATDEAQIRRLLDEATRNKVEGRWNPPPDEYTRGQLIALNSAIKDWAREWATKSLVLERATNKESIKYFSDFIRLDPDGNFPQFIRRPSTRLKNRISAHLLQAALSHQVHDAFFDGKFFCLNAKESDVLDRLFEALRKADSTNANIWRAGLWRLMNPNTAEDQIKTPAILEESRNNIRAYYETVSATFLKKPIGFLLEAVAENSTEAQNRSMRLRTILQQASIIALSLYTQHCMYTSVDLAGIKEQKMTFDNTSLVLEAHPWSDVDEDDDKANGREIIMVSKPGLLVRDAHDKSGWQGNQYRVLSKAVVLLEGTH